MWFCSASLALWLTGDKNFSRTKGFGENLAEVDELVFIFLFVFMTKVSFPVQAVDEVDRTFQRDSVRL